jgi:hypothetical protein
VNERVEARLVVHIEVLNDFYLGMFASVGRAPLPTSSFFMKNMEV